MSKDSERPAPAPNATPPAVVAPKAGDAPATTGIGGLSGKTIGIGVGIGSAAIVAALLFVNRGKGK